MHSRNISENKVLEFDKNGNLVKESGDLINLYLENVGYYHIDYEYIEKDLQIEKIYVKPTGEDEYKLARKIEKRTIFDTDCSCLILVEEKEDFENNILRNLGAFEGEQMSVDGTSAQIRKVDLPFIPQENIENKYKAENIVMMYEIDTLSINISYCKNYQNSDQLHLRKVEVVDTVHVNKKNESLRRRMIYYGWKFVSEYQDLMSNVETDFWMGRLWVIGTHQGVEYYIYRTDDYNNWIERKTLYNDKVIRIETREIEYF